MHDSFDLVRTICEAHVGEARAMRLLAASFAAGQGVPRDPAEASWWYERAARAGDGLAAATLGVMYAIGQDIEQSADRAKEYFSLAAANGFDWKDMATAMRLPALLA